MKLGESLEKLRKYLLEIGEEEASELVSITMTERDALVDAMTSVVFMYKVHAASRGDPDPEKNFKEHMEKVVYEKYEKLSKATRKQIEGGEGCVNHWKYL